MSRVPAMPMEPASAANLAELRARVAAATASSCPALPFGVASLDDRLARRGLEVDVLHEVAPTS